MIIRGLETVILKSEITIIFCFQLFSHYFNKKVLRYLFLIAKEGTFG